MEILQEMPENSTNIESDNWIKRYQRRPKVLLNFCLADFVSKFDVILAPKERRHIQNGLLIEDELDERNDDDCEAEIDVEDHAESLNQKKEFPMKDGSVLRLRETRKIIRYVHYNKEQDPENFYREQLMLFYPWRNEEKDLKGSENTFEANYLQHEEVIQTNKMPFKTDRDIITTVEQCIEHISFQAENVVSAEIQHSEEIVIKSEDHCHDGGCFNPTLLGINYDLGLDLGITRKQVERNDIQFNSVSDTEFKNLAKILNEKQKVFFYHVLHKVKTDDLPIYCFLTGGAGVGKSLLTTCLFQAVSRFFAKRIAENADEVKAVLCAPTGKAAYNIGGHTIHSLFCIPANQNLNYKHLDAKQLDMMRVKF